MKKIVLIIILLIVIQLFAFTQEQPKYLLEFNGNEWNSWIPIAKQTFIAGWMSSAYSLIIAIEENSSFNFTEEEKYQLSTFLFLTDNVLSVVEKPNQYYSIPETRETYIWVAVYYVFNKWWGVVEENSTSEKMDEIVKQGEENDNF